MFGLPGGPSSFHWGQGSGLCPGLLLNPCDVCEWTCFMSLLAHWCSVYPGPKRAQGLFLVFLCNRGLHGFTLLTRVHEHCGLDCFRL